jgi:hypothetical protein
VHVPAPPTPHTRRRREVLRRRAIAGAWSISSLVLTSQSSHCPSSPCASSSRRSRAPEPFSFPAEPSSRTGAPAAEVNSRGRRPCFAFINPPSSLLPSHAQVYQWLIPTLGSTQPRPQRPPRQAPMIPAAPHRRTSSTPPQRRQRASGELRDVLVFLHVQTASQIVHRSAQTAISGDVPAKHRRAPLGAAVHRRVPTCVPPQPPDLKSTARIRSG